MSDPIKTQATIDMIERYSTWSQTYSNMVEDAISRKAAIDAVERAKTAQTPDGEIYVAKLNAEMNIQILPSAQPEIIRCKDCTNWDTTWTNDWTPNYHYCPIIDGVRRDYFYCADAERRTDA